MKILKSIVTLLIILVWGFVLNRTVVAHTSQHTVPHDDPMTFDTVVELKTPVTKIPEIPDVRLVSFEDPFAVKPLIRNLSEEDWKLLESISIAEAGNQDVEGVALVMLTVLNRCERNNASVRATIYAPSQFYVQGMSGGNELSKEARELVSCGWDESQGCLYFCSTGWNHYGNEHLFKHGSHWFSR